MPSSADPNAVAADLRTAALELHAAVDLIDARDADLRRTLVLVAGSLGDLARTSESLCRDFSAAEVKRAPGPARVSSDVVRRCHELSASLRAAQRNAELVCRHLPRPEVALSR